MTTEPTNEAAAMATPSPNNESAIPKTMRAITRERFGGPEVLSLSEIAVPEVTEGRMLIQVKAASINPYDWHMIRALPHLARLSAGLTKPKYEVPGADVAGIVVAVGSGVTKFAVGDEVFGGTMGSFAEYALVRERSVVHKPENVTFAEAAASVMAGETALQGLRDHGKVKQGDKVAVVGASGGVGSHAVMIAKAMGAEVTAICSGRNAEMVRSLGADHVVDYTQEDFTAAGITYDVIYDVVSTHPLADYRRALTDDGIYVSAGAIDMGGDWFGPIGHLGRLMIANMRGSQTMKSMLAKGSTEDMEILADYLASGEITPVIDRTYALADMPEAMEYIETMRARGKVIIDPTS